MLRITCAPAADTQDAQLLRLEGQVTGLWVEELRRVCNETISHDGHGTHSLVLDLTHVSFIDADGVALFRQLTNRRVGLTNCSGFVTEQLKEVAHADD
jgi:anti-anti-sigma regulatory factor